VKAPGYTIRETFDLSPSLRGTADGLDSGFISGNA